MSSGRANQAQRGAQHSSGQRKRGSACGLEPRGSHPARTAWMSGGLALVLAGVGAPLAHANDGDALGVGARGNGSNELRGTGRGAWPQTHTGEIRRITGSSAYGYRGAADEAVPLANVVRVLQRAQIATERGDAPPLVTTTALQVALMLNTYLSQYEAGGDAEHVVGSIDNVIELFNITGLDLEALALALGGFGDEASEVDGEGADGEGEIAGELPDDGDGLPGGADPTIDDDGVGAGDAADAAGEGDQEPPEYYDGEPLEPLTSLTIGGREVQLAEVTWEDVTNAAMYLAGLMSPDTNIGAAVSVTLPGMEFAGEGFAYQTMADLLKVLVDKYGATTDGLANGVLPASVLCPLPMASQIQVRCDAGGALTALNHAFENVFGYPLPIGSGYRTFAGQVAAALANPHLAASPGTSMHGWGLAVDFASPISNFGSAEYQWLLENAPTYGWENPAWAQATGSKPEPWHFEFMAVARPKAAAGPSVTGLASRGPLHLGLKYMIDAPFPGKLAVIPGQGETGGEAATTPGGGDPGLDDQHGAGGASSDEAPGGGDQAEGGEPAVGDGGAGQGDGGAGTGDSGSGEGGTGEADPTGGEESGGGAEGGEPSGDHQDEAVKPDEVPVDAGISEAAGPADE